MRKTLLLTSLFLTSLVYGQDWTKSERQNLFDKSMNNFVSNKGLTKEQEKAVSLCFMESITSEFTPQEYNSKIDIELEVIHQSFIDRCSKKIGVNLKEEEKSSDKKSITFSNLVGHWQGEGGRELYLQSNNKFVYINEKGITTKGKWRIEGEKLLLGWVYSFNVLEVSEKELTLNKGRKIFKYKKT